MIYLDSNVFIYACLNADEIGEKSRKLLRDIEDGSVEASTSALSFDEITWAVKKFRNMDQAISAGEAFVGMPGLNLMPVDESVLRSSLDLMRRYDFDPRDSIHAASAIMCRADAMISADSHFDKLEKPPRRHL